MKGQKKNPLYKSFGYAFEGIFTGIKKERNMKIHCLAMLCVVAAGFVLRISVSEWCICLILFGMILSLELVNTAMEAVVDLVTEERRPLAKACERYSGGGSFDCGNYGSRSGTFDFCPESVRTYINKEFHGKMKGDRMMEGFGESVKKLLLAGIGAAATTAEKSKELLDDMVEKGELTVEQGKALNEELKHNIKKTVKENVNVSVKPTSPEELDELLEKMTPEQIEALKERLNAMEGEQSETEQQPDEEL